MDFPLIIGLSFVLLVIITFVIAMILRYVMFTSAEGAVKRLKDDIEKANALQAQLGLKLKAAEEELTKRQAEAKALADKMKADAEAVSREEREKIISNARKEGEEIIAKAQNAKQKIAEELEKENDIRMINFSMEIVNKILNDKSKAALEDVLIGDFFESLKSIDMTRINPDINAADVITLHPLNEAHKNQLLSILKEKLKREVQLKPAVDKNLGGGILLKFGSMALDGSIKNQIREYSVTMLQNVSSR